MIGEEFLTASAILSDKPDLKGSIRGQDVIKLIAIAGMVVAAAFSINVFLNINL